MIWRHMLMVAAGGALGALSRYAIFMLVQHRLHHASATIIANAVGCALFGLAVGVGVLSRDDVPHAVKLLIFTGFLGAMTTFSTYAADTIELAGEASFHRAAGYVVLQNVLGLGLFWLGIQSGRLFA